MKKISSEGTNEDSKAARQIIHFRFSDIQEPILRSQVTTQLTAQRVFRTDCFFHTYALAYHNAANPTTVFYNASVVNLQRHG
jgi:hypothetical protein